MSDKAPEAEAREFAVAFRAFLDWIGTSAREERNEVVALMTDFLGADGAAHFVVTRELPPLEHINLQAALDDWCASSAVSPPRCCHPVTPDLASLPVSCSPGNP